MNNYQVVVPAKTFLLGEYAVLKGQDALVMKTEPKFKFNFRVKPGGKIEFHPDSLAGKLIREQDVLINNYELIIADPYNGLGGLGLSSAEFIAMWIWLEQIKYNENRLILNNLYSSFLAITNELASPPSGADIIAQCVAPGLVQVNFNSLELANKVVWQFESTQIVLFHTLQHCVTHQHLVSKINIPDELLLASQQGIQAVLDVDFTKFIDSVNRFVASQFQAGLLAITTKNYLDKFNKITGVHVAKGCGAMGQDVLAVVCDTGSVSKVLTLGRSWGLLPLYSGNCCKDNLGTKLTKVD